MSHTTQSLFRRIVTILALFLSAATALAQITITRSDFLNAMQVGNRGTGYTTPPLSKVPVNVGTASSSEQTWDFRNLTYTKQSDGVVIDAATAPQRADFPDANIVYQLTMPGLAMIMYQYQQVTQNQYLLHGLGYSDATPLYRYTPPAIQMTFPCTRGTTWVYTADPTSPVAGVTMQSTFTWTCDAFGTLRLPNGDFSALRLITETVTQSTTPAGSSIMRSYRYNFVTRTLTGATVSIDSTEIGQANVNGTVGYVAAGGPSNAESASSPATAQLALPSPHPVRGSAMLAFTLPNAGYSRLEVWDMLGRRISVLLDGEGSAGSQQLRWDATDVPTGTYLLRLHSGAAYTSLPILVVR